MSEACDRLFGQIAVLMGLLTPAQVAEALRAQAAQRDSPAPLGVLFVERGWLTAEQAAVVLREQQRVEAAKAAATPRMPRPPLPAPATPVPLAASRPAAGAPHDIVREEPAGGRTVPLAEGREDVAATSRMPPRPCPASETVEPIEVSPVPEGEAVSGEPGAPGPRRFGKYELVAELGRGGMGVVYKAYHPGLKSYFAVKVLLAGSDASALEIDRFHREAEAAARLKHPGIVAVHDIGQGEGKTYFAMEYVEGKSLDKVLDDPHAVGLAPAPLPRPRVRRAPADSGSRSRAWGLTPAVAVRMTQEIAEALQCAHEAGVVHRDLKPANVIRDRAGRLKVMDFGLAKLVDTAGKTGATRTGAVMGTPAYMSPEQAEGRVKEVDAVSDVYQLGAILYELLTGRPPYEGETAMDVLLKVMQEDPPPLRRLNPHIPRDVETICAKAMARERAGRYASARGLSEDCRRLLADEPILARPPAWWERPLRSVRRRKLLTGVAAAALLAGALAGYNQWDKWSVQERARLEQQRIKEEARRNEERLERDVLTGLRAIASSNVKAVLAVRRNGGKMSEIEKDFLPPLKDAAEKAIAQAPGLAEPHYHLGRMYRALMEFTKAREEQEKALAKDADFAPSLYERAVLLAIDHRMRVRRLRDDWLAREGVRLAEGGALAKGGGGGEKMRPAPADDDLAAGDEEAGRIRAGIAAAVQRLEGERAAAGAAGLSPAMRRVARALRLRAASQVQADWEAARALFEQARAEEPGLEEGVEACAEAAPSWEKRIAIYAEGIEADKGYVPFRIGRGQARVNWGLDKTNCGGDPEAVDAAAIADFDKALELDPTCADAWMSRGYARFDLGMCRADRGADPGELFAAAIADYGKALELNPAYGEAWNRRGAARGNWGTYKETRGGDPGELYAAAIADYGKALELYPAYAEAWNGRGVVRGNWANYKQTRGADPGELYAAAIADYGKALELNPAYAKAWTYRGNARDNWATCKQERGANPGELFAAAIADYGKALELDPASAKAWTYRGLARVNWGNYKQARGADPGELYAAAIADYGKALELDPASAEAWTSGGKARVNWGVYKADRGADPGELYAAAITDFGKALELNPASAEAWMERGGARANWGNYKQTRGADPGELFAAAIADYGMALELNPAYGKAWNRRGLARGNWGVYKQTCGADPGELYAGAIADYAKALELNPASVEAWSGRGLVRGNWGSYKEASGADPGELYAAAIADFGKALEMNPASAEAWMNRGLVRGNWGNYKQTRGADPGELYATAIADCGKALELNPASAEAHWRRGCLHYAMKRWPDTVADFEAAIRLNPDAARDVGTMLADARARLSAAGAPAARPAWLAAVERGSAAAQNGDYASARAAYQEGLAAFDALTPSDRDRARADPAARAALADARYNLACLLSLASVGRAGPEAEAKPIPPAEAASLRGAAFDHLHEAMKLGWSDGAALEADADLEPLRADPRWVELLKRLKK